MAAKNIINLIISITLDMQMIPPLWQKVKEESENVGIKLRKLRSRHPVPSLHGK